MAKRNLMTLIGAASVMAATSSETLGSDLEAFDVQIDMNNQRDLEDALAADVDTFVTGVDAIDESEDRIQTLEEGIDTMPTEALVGGVAQLEVVAGQVDDMTDSVPSLEALSSDVREATRRSLEAIGEKLKAAWTTLKEFGAGVINKIKDMFEGFLVWIGDSAKKATALLKVIEDKETLKEGIDLEKLSKKIGTKLVAISAITGTSWSITAPTTMKNLYANVKDITEKSGNALSAAMVKNAASHFDVMPAIGEGEYLVVGNVAGKSLSFVEMVKIEDVVGFKSLGVSTVSNSGMVSMKLKEVSSLADIKSALEFVVELGTKGKLAKTELLKLVSDVEIDLKSEVDKVKYKGSMMPGLAYIGAAAVTGAAIGAGGAAIGAPAGAAIGASAGAGYAIGMIAMARDPKEFDKLSASDKVRYVRNKSRFITWYTKSVLLGINNLGKDIIGSAKIMLDQYEGKSAAPAAEAE